MPPARTKTRPVTLNDLSTEDRKALLEEAREQAKRNPVDVDGYEELTERERAIRALMDARDHIRECPVQTGSELGRVEGYEARKPPRPDLGEPAREVAVIRCVECGGSTVREDDRLEPLIAAAIRGDVDVTPAESDDDDNDDDL